MSNPKPVEGVRVEALAAWLEAAWMKYLWLFHEPPHGTLKQMQALCELESEKREAALSAAAPAPKGPRRITQQEVDEILLKVVGERWHQAKRQLIAEHINELVGAAAPARDGVRDEEPETHECDCLYCQVIHKRRSKSRAAKEQDDGQ